MELQHKRSKKKMKRFYFFEKNDPKKEAIDVTTAKSKDDAIIHFADRKKLTLRDFSKIFEVEIKNEKT